jgi:hydroxymethylpyrimidine/phosphomethylpyrimidine kinase
MASKPLVLSIAGYDPSSGAGITADVKTAAAMGCYAVTCITALTVQSTQGVFEVVPAPLEVVRETLYRLFEDVEIAAVRIGMLGTALVTRVVANFFRRYTHPNVVFDPVLRASSGTALLDEQGVEVVRKFLLRRVGVVTPNFEEAQVLAGESPFLAPDSWEQALPRVRELAGKLQGRGCPGVVITGGELPEANDFLSVWTDGKTEEQVFSGTHLDSRSTHGTGCAFATALACGLAHGRRLPDAVGDAKEYVRRAIAASYPVGKGTGPINHLFGLEDG